VRLAADHGPPEVQEALKGVSDARGPNSHGTSVAGTFARSLHRHRVATRVRLLAGVIFGILDTDHSGGVGGREMGAGLTVLCRGTRAEKTSAAFALWDADGSGALDERELGAYLGAVFRVRAASEPGFEGLGRLAGDGTLRGAVHASVLRVGGAVMQLRRQLNGNRGGVVRSLEETGVYLDEF